ncbi:MAG: hypothetical protein Q7T61_00830 [Caulobacter sp.]|nr:hypothetical protein [Caulobacter sp.]
MSTETVIFPDGGKVIGKEAFERFKADCLRPATPSEKLMAIVRAHRERVALERIRGDGGSTV